MSRAISICIAALLALGLAACGSGSPSSDSTAAAGGAPTSAPAKSGTGQGSAPAGLPGGSQRAQKERSEGSGGSSTEEPESGSTSGGGYGYRPDNSLQTFGKEVHDRAKAEVSRAVLALFRSFAKPDYEQICGRIAEANLEQIRQYAELKRVPEQSCPEVLATLMSPPNRTIRQSPRSEITHVRVDGDEAIVFFRPPGGGVSYIPMVREGGRWRSVTLVPGTPVNMDLGQQ